MDTRPTDNVGSRSTPLGPTDTHAIAVRGTNGNCTIPADAVGLVMNVAAIAPTGNSFLTVFPSDVNRPLAANLNWTAGQAPLSNAVTADISADGRVSFFNFAGTVHVAADIVGYFVDHHHDDRYYTRGETYTKAEIDATKANKPTGAATLNLEPAAFHPDVSGANFSHDFSTGGITTTTGVCPVAAVFLPQGATITNITAHAIDAVAGNGTLLMYRNPNGSGTASELMASAASSGNPGTITVSDNTITAPVIDNVNNGYLVSFCTAAGMGFHGIIINYNHP
jgi:hypothetical protein